MSLAKLTSRDNHTHIDKKESLIVKGRTIKKSSSTRLKLKKAPLANREKEFMDQKNLSSFLSSESADIKKESLEMDFKAINPNFKKGKS